MLAMETKNNAVYGPLDLHEKLACLQDDNTSFQVGSYNTWTLDYMDLILDLILDWTAEPTN